MADPVVSPQKAKRQRKKQRQMATASVASATDRKDSGRAATPNASAKGSKIRKQRQAQSGMKKGKGKERAVDAEDGEVLSNESSNAGSGERSSSSRSGSGILRRRSRSASSGPSIELIEGFHDGGKGDRAPEQDDVQMDGDELPFFVVDTQPGELPEELRMKSMQESKIIPDYAAAPPESAARSETGADSDLDGPREVVQGSSKDLLAPSVATTRENTTDAEVYTTAAETTEEVPIHGEEDSIEIDERPERDAPRYFKEDDPLQVCQRCGESGHSIRKCEHLQCLTCGKLDDHGTKACPLTMICFRCQSRGHHIKDCPIDPMRAPSRLSNSTCSRCSSRLHSSSNCPYIWRVYIRSPSAPSNPSSTPKIRFACYNCASSDHFGDDCKFPRAHPVKVLDRSAFTSDPNKVYKGELGGRGSAGGPSRNTFGSDSGYEHGRERLPRPNIVNGVKMHDSNIPKGPRGGPNGRDSYRGHHDEGLREYTRTEPGARKRGRGNSSLEEGEADEDDEADDFAKRLQGNNKSSSTRPLQSRDNERRTQGQSQFQRAVAATVGGSMAGEGGRKPWDPFKSRSRPRSRSNSPPIRQHKRFSDRNSDYDAGQRSRNEDSRDRERSGWDNPPTRDENRVDRKADRRGPGGRQRSPPRPPLPRDPPPPPPPAEPSKGSGFSRGSLLDRIDRGRDLKDSYKPPGGAGRSKGGRYRGGYV